MKTAKLKAAATLTAVLAELQSRNGKTLNQTMTPAQARAHIRAKYRRHIANGGSAENALTIAKQSIVGFNNGTWPQWLMFCPALSEKPLSNNGRAAENRTDTQSRAAQKEAIA